MTQKPRIVIDPGHGGADSGTSGGGLFEKDMALKYALTLGHFLRELGYAAEFTRTTDETLDQKERYSVARMGDILISCHLNGVTNRSAHGCSIWYHTGVAASKELANAVYGGIMELGFFTRYGSGILGDESRYPGAGFYMLRHAVEQGCTRCILCEPGFLTNGDDRAVFADEHKRNLLAKAIADSVHSYIQANWR